MKIDVVVHKVFSIVQVTEDRKEEKNTEKIVVVDKDVFREEDNRVILKEDFVDENAIFNLKDIYSLPYQIFNLSNQEEGKHL